MFREQSHLFNSRSIISSEEAMLTLECAKGGQISWYNESQRRHGALKKPEEQISIKQLIAGTQGQTGEVMGKGSQQSPDDELLRARKGRRDNGG